MTEYEKRQLSHIIGMLEQMAGADESYDSGEDMRMKNDFHSAEKKIGRETGSV